MPSKSTIAVAGRVSPSTANKLVENAKQLGITLSKQIELVLSNWSEEDDEVERIHQAWQQASAELINHYADGDASKQRSMRNFLTKKLKG